MTGVLFKVKNGKSRMRLSFGFNEARKLALDDKSKIKLGSYRNNWCIVESEDWKIIYATEFRFQRSAKLSPR